MPAKAQQKSDRDTVHDDRIDAVCVGTEYFYDELDGVTPIKVSLAA